MFMGLIASGKSTLAQLWAQDLTASYYNSDVIRKELAGAQQASGQGAGYGQAIYTPEFSRLTYDELMVRAFQQLAVDRAAVIDASYHALDERRRLINSCVEHGYPYQFILCTCSQSETRRRLEVRAQDTLAVSDGTWEIYLKQLDHFQYPTEISPDHFLELSTDASPADLLVQLRRHLPG